MKSPLLMLHDAQLERLKARTERDIYDGTPQKVPYPYISMGEFIAKDWSDKFQAGQDVLSTLHVWSQYPGKAEVLQIVDEIERVLTESPLDLGADFHAVVDKLDDVRIIVDMDGITRHGIVTYRYLIEEV